VPSEQRDAWVRFANANAPWLRVMQCDGSQAGVSVLRDHGGLLAKQLRVGKGPMAALVRPDMHLAARVNHPTVELVKAALRRVQRQAL
jgi:hypothetical protein